MLVRKRKEEGMASFSKTQQDNEEGGISHLRENSMVLIQENNR
jgi:hypothetical protein